MTIKEMKQRKENRVLESAIDLFLKGRRVIPLHHPLEGGGCSCGKPGCKHPGKHPVEKAWPSRSFASEEQIRDWLRKHPCDNIGVITGMGFLVIDIDVDRGGEESLKALIAELGPLPPTVRVKTGHGYHLWFKYPEAEIIPCGQNKPLVGIDIRGENGLAVAPGSLHFTGVRYEYEPGYGIGEIEVAELPETWLARLRPSREASGGDRAAIEEALYELELNDQGNAKRVVELCSEDMRFSPDFAEWLVWNGRIWVVDKRSLAKHQVAARLAPIFVELARREANKTIRGALYDEAEKVKGVGPAKAVLEAAKAHDSMCIEGKNLNARLHQICVGNGILDLPTGTLLAFERAAFFTEEAPVVFDPNATCPRFDRFVSEIMGGNEELVAFLIRFLGYILCGERSEEVVAIFHGNGANGKSTLIRVMERLLGAYAVSIVAKTLVARPEGINNDLASCRFARMVVASEWDDRNPIGEGNLKRLTGRDKVKARFLYHEYIEYDPQFQIVLLVNTRPSFDGQDEGLWRRILLVPFTQRFRGDACDPHLDEKLFAELPGILNRLLAGYLDWREQGLKQPAAVKAATSDFRKDVDVIGQFLGDRCVIDPSADVQSSVLYDDYKAWAVKSGFRPMDTRKFAGQIKSRGFDNSHSGKNGCVMWHGMRLKSDSAGFDPLNLDILGFTSVREEAPVTMASEILGEGSLSSMIEDASKFYI
jgi:P4 family phage/plasmid primase-like protien